MNFLHFWFTVLPAMLALGLVAWAIATLRRNAGLVDIFWSLFFLLAAIGYAMSSAWIGLRAPLVLALVAIWSMRLALYLAARNWNAEEDHRYRAIRARNDPGFAWKSLYLVFGLQAVLAWVIAAPLAGSFLSTEPLGLVSWVGAALACAGVACEALADAQLARFKANPDHAGKVMDQGLWRYSRHPNYFCEWLLWFSYVALAATSVWWPVALIVPVVLLLLLLMVTGIPYTEKRALASRGDDYRAYQRSTSPFIPWFPRSESTP